MAEHEVRDKKAQEEVRQHKKVQPVYDQLKQAAEPEDSGTDQTEAILRLQQTYGNRYVQRLVEGGYSGAPASLPGSLDSSPSLDDLAGQPKVEQRLIVQCQQESGAPSPEVEQEGEQQAVETMQLLLDPSSLRAALLQLPLNLTLPSVLTPTTPTESGRPLVPQGAGRTTPRLGTLGDILNAVMAVPAIDRVLNNLQTLATERVEQDWSRLSTGERIAVISQLAVIAGGALAGALSNPESRKFVFDQLSGRVLPVPGLTGLGVEFNAQGDNLMLGLHLDVGSLLPSWLGFGPSSPRPIGAPLGAVHRLTSEATIEVDESRLPKGIGQQVEPPKPPLLESPLVQRAEEENRQGEAYEVPPTIAARIEAQRPLGKPLEPEVRSQMEVAFRHDLSKVRVHADVTADYLAQQLEARAFTTGLDIFFRAGEYRPHSQRGEKLVAHELVHVLQQEAGNASKTLPVIQRLPDDGDEGGQAVEAGRTAGAVATATEVLPTETQRVAERITVEYGGESLTFESRDELVSFLASIGRLVELDYRYLQDLQRRDERFFGITQQTGELLGAFRLAPISIALAESTDDVRRIATSLLQRQVTLCEDVGEALAHERRTNARLIARRIQEEREQWKRQRAHLLSEMRTAFRAGNEDLIGELTDAYSSIGGFIEDAASVYEEIWEWNGRSPLPISTYVDFLNKAMEVVNYLSGLGDEVPGLASPTEQALGELRRAWDTVDVVTSLLDLTPDLYDVFYGHIGPALEAISSSWSRVEDYMREENDAWYQIYGPELVRWGVEPGERELHNYLVGVFAAEEPADVPAMPESVNDFFLGHRDLLNAVMTRVEFGTEMPTERRWIFWREIRPQEFKSWIWVHRELVWQLIYGTRTPRFREAGTP